MCGGTGESHTPLVLWKGKRCLGAHLGIPFASLYGSEEFDLRTFKSHIRRSQNLTFPVGLKLKTDCVLELHILILFKSSSNWHVLLKTMAWEFIKCAQSNGCEGFPTDVAYMFI